MRSDLEHIISLITRMLIVVAVVVSIYMVVTILLIWKHRITGNIVLAMIVLASLAVAINYLYWLPRYRVP